jgi:hypothetical protein
MSVRRIKKGSPLANVVYAVRINLLDLAVGQSFMREDIPDLFREQSNPGK